MNPLEFGGADPAEGQVSPDPVVETLDVLEERERCLLAALERPRVHALGPDDARRRLGHGVVPRRGYGPHGRPDAVAAHGLAEEQASVLRAVARMVQPLPGRPRAMAILGASSAGSAVILGPIDHPTTIPGHTSMTTARQGRPWCVRAWVMPANHASFGPVAPESRLARSSCESAPPRAFPPRPS